MTRNSLQLRPPRLEDAASVWRLVGRAGQLERNSCYTYLLLCSHFQGTSIVAERDGALVGFALGYRPPSTCEEIFVWQVGVAPTERRQGLARRMLDVLIKQPACRDVRFLTATVSADNTASLALFRGFARACRVNCEERPWLASTLFAEPHLDESLLRVGPLKGQA